MGDRKRMGRRERAHMKYMAKCHAHERTVADRTRRERTARHRGNLLRKVEDLGQKDKIENRATSPRLGFLRRLLGRR